MSDPSPLLTISVPTYNRSRYLARLLNSLKPQLANERRVELLISDNASPDETPATLDQYRRDGLIFRSIRNQENLGADRNIAQCFSEASGKYVWIIGDDDVLVSGCLSAILRILEQDEFDLVHLLAKDFVEGQPLHLPSRPLKMEIIQDTRIFTRRTHVFLTFITGNIVNKQRVDSLPHAPFSQLIGTSLVQLGWMYTALAHLRKAAYVYDPVIAAGADDRGGYALYTVFGTNLKHITETWLAKPALVRTVLNGTLQTFFPAFVLRSRRKESVFLDEKPDALLASLFSNNFRYYLFIYPLLKLPAGMGKFWLLLCRIVNRLDRAVGNPMLR
jgi:abequosyltransferase